MERRTGEVLDELDRLHREGKVYVAGGAVRDWLLGRPAVDIDLVVSSDAVALCGRFASRAGGRCVLLDEAEGVARAVCPGVVVDFSRYRGGVSSLHADLALRDFTMNAMALPLETGVAILRDEERDAGPPGEALARRRSRAAQALIDPHGGRTDLDRRLVRAISRGNLAADPLRLLRAYRFRAELDFEIDGETMGWMRDLAPSMKMVAAERIHHELHAVMASPRAGRTLGEMVNLGLFFRLVPEAASMEGVDQPGFHHLDVLGHSLATVRAIEALIEDPCGKFSPCGPLKEWILADREHVPCLKWAGLLHDVGKPHCRGRRGERVTFYRHDRAGSDIAGQVGRRLRWPGRQAAFVARFVRLHMRPFHLLRDLRGGGPTGRAMRRLLMEVEADYPGLFLLAMADSMAGCGPLKPPELDAELGLLWGHVHHFYVERLLPRGERRRFLSGHDLQREFGLTPGPLIGKALDALDLARVEGVVGSREDAREWMAEWLRARGLCNRPCISA